MDGCFEQIVTWVVAFMMGFVMGFYTREAGYESELVERGLAIYCPHDGAFAFKGECPDDKSAD